MNIRPEPIQPAISIIGGKKFAQINTSVQDEQTVVIPQQIIIPDQRLALPSGFLAQGDKISLALNIVDADGNVKELPEIDGYSVELSDWPDDPTNEILMVLNVSFTQSTKPILDQPVLEE